MGMELLGTYHEFASLEILSFKRMSGWMKWSTNGGVLFPRLQKLYIKDCPNLVEVTLEALPSLNVLEIYKCDSCVLTSLVQVAPAVTKLKIRDVSRLNDAVWRVVMQYLGAIEELSIDRCNEIRYLWESEAVAGKLFVNLKTLEVECCDNLVSLGEKEDEDNWRSNLLTSLRMLSISDCKNMERCRCPYSIEKLQVMNCDSITDVFLPAEGQKLKSLVIRGCKNLLEKEWGGKKMNNRMLEYVDIYGWSNLKSIVELKYLVNLTRLSLWNCKSLESFPENDLANLTSLKDLQISNCPRMDACGIWPPNLHSLKIGELKKSISEWGPQNFPSSLVELDLYGGDEDGMISSFDQISHLLPSSLTSLGIIRFEKLKSDDGMGLQHLTSLQLLRVWLCPNLHKLSHLQHLTSIKSLEFWLCPNLSTLSQPQQLTSLQHLEFRSCPKMMDLPEAMLPSLLSLTICGDCPEDLKERCSKGGSYWPLISHIPKLEI